MLKYTCTLLLIICGATNSYSQTQTPNTTKRSFVKNETANKYRKNWHTNHLKGRVKTIIQVYYDGPATDTTTPDVFTKEYFYYDSTGNLTAHVKQEEDSRPDSTTYKYNTDNKWTEMFFYSGNGITDVENYNVFDSKGNLIEEGERYGDQSTNNKLISEYDQYGGKTKSTLSGLVTEFINTYDKDGLLIMQQNIINKEVNGKTTWKYDNVGHIIEEAEYAKDGELLRKVSTRFNKIHLPDSLAIIKKGYSDNVQEYRYDSLGYVISQGNTDPRTKTWLAKWEFSYESDQQGNWTKCITYDSHHAIAGATIRKNHLLLILPADHAGELSEFIDRLFTWNIRINNAKSQCILFQDQYICVQRIQRR